MKSALAAFFVLTVVPAVFRPGPGESTAPAGDGARFTTGDRLLWPEDYRQWVWLSSGLGMSYREGDGEPQFDNVFVDPASYQSFVLSGRWPDGTMLVVEERDAESRESINRSGRFQGAFQGVEVEVKNRVGWTFYSFGLSTKPAGAIPAGAACYSCHQRNGGVDQTFVQFYPTLRDIARQHGTLRQPRGPG